MNCILSWQFLVLAASMALLTPEVTASPGCVSVSMQFEPFDPACPPSPSGAINFSVELHADSSLSCALQCAVRALCGYFRFDLNNICSLSNRALGMTHRKHDPRLPACRRVCRGSRLFCVVQQRLTNTVNFTRPWSNYELGFGDDVNFWIGLQLLNQLTTQSKGQILRAEIYNWSNALHVAEYAGFVVGEAAEKYAMNYTAFLSASSNTSDDSLRLNRGRRFSTTDRDNDDFGSSCSNAYHGGAGWWFGGCSNVNPNGWMTASEVVDCPKCIHWFHVHRNKNSLKAVRLLLQLP